MDELLQACEELDIGEESCALIRQAGQRRAAVTALIGQGHLQDALKLLTRLLPHRYVVAWLCQCMRDESLPESDLAGVAIAERWVREPEERHRRAAYEFAVADNYRSLGAWVAATAGFAGGSLAPKEQEVAVPPPPHLTSRAATAALNLLAAVQPEAFDERRAAFMRRAIYLLGDEPDAV